MTQRAHFEVLDGLRGVAAVLVLGFHLSEIVSGGNPARNIFPHGALAVDFFFALSGFVIAHAYDARMAQGLGFGGFLLRRVVRLHPLVPLATAIGALAWLFGPDQGALPHVAGPGFALAVALALFVLPYPTLAGRWDDTHSLDGPTWTLLQEYVGSIAYGLVLWRVPLRWLGWLLVPAGVALIAGGLAHGTIASGFGWSNWEMAPTRLAFPFIAGIAVRRLLPRLTRLRISFWGCAILLTAALALPVPGGRLGAGNALLEAGCVMVLFPLLLLMGAHSRVSAGSLKVARALGRLSYPLYIVHYPFIYCLADVATNGHPSPARLNTMALALFPAMLVLGWAALRLWDEPLRNWASARLKRS